ncbi:TVP38/TMEM64 family protein [Jeotgalibacillus terrae]|uniref:TVP38/TMEM64 family membrane protein n=1 Tax=Jeotgalibacillus terrae TaxID=587735 RepID=A0ABW5ZNU6_9BACL|nr:VTT domain-containing protein [Jeotgalibacillus terrae]MBM7580463.1 putative membrane protein YdjX (TVP38/TMEM64 family) [Jeotgalibacillus terrae]
MDELSQVQHFIEESGWLGPALFVLLHLLRPLLFLPVILVCVAGGLLFGFVEGAILSFIGLTLMSFVSYVLIYRFPSFKNKLSKLKDKVLPDRHLSVGQIMVLRIMPFVHFHLLSFYLMEMTDTRKEYMFYSMIGVIAPAVIYTAFGGAIHELPWYGTAVLFILLLIVYKVIGKMNDDKINTIS